MGDHPLVTTAVDDATSPSKASDEDRRRRAAERRSRVVLRRSSLGEERDLSPICGAEAVSLVATLTREAWALGGLPMPDYGRHQTPLCIVPFSSPTPPEDTR